MKQSKCKWAVCCLAALFAGAPWAFAALTYVDITPPTRTAGPTAPGSYTDNGGGVFTLTSDGTGFYPNMDLTPVWDDSITNWNFLDVNGNPKTNGSGDVMTFMYETVNGDFDRRVRVMSIANSSAPNDSWTRGGIMARTGTNWYTVSWQVIAANPVGANCVVFCGRPNDGGNYVEWDRRQSGVTNALPNQWLRLRRIGHNFMAYVGVNGSNWTLVAQRYMIQPDAMLIGPHAASGTYGAMATVQFANYGPTPLYDTNPPTVVSCGSIDKLEIGVKFSEPVSRATATVLANYHITQGGGGAVTITSAKLGIGGDSVHLKVTGLTNDNFTVTVLGGVQDTAGNTIAANSAVGGKSLNWAHTDIGWFKDITNRPQPGDDPYYIGESVAISSDETPEIEIVGGGSNHWNPGDNIHYVYIPQKMGGDFDVGVAVLRYDHSYDSGSATGGWASSGVEMRDGLYTPGYPTSNAYTNQNATKAPYVAFEADVTADSPGWAAQTYWRNSSGGNGSLDGAGGTVGWGTPINGIKGYFYGLNCINASGDTDPQSSPTSARWVRIKRTGNAYQFYLSYDGSGWALNPAGPAFINLPDQMYYGFSCWSDSGYQTPPYAGYWDNSHQMTPDDPLAWYNSGYTNSAGTPARPPGDITKDTSYTVCRVKMLPNGLTAPVPVSLIKLDIRSPDAVGSGELYGGSWTSIGNNSFKMTGGGRANLEPLGYQYSGGTAGVYDGSVGGDNMTFAYEGLTGDFDRQVCLTSLTNLLYTDSSGTIYDYASNPNPPVDTWCQAGLMVRAGTNSYDPDLLICAANPVGANVVQVAGHGAPGQNYTVFSREYPGVNNTLSTSNQFLRIQRVGNNFSFYVGQDGLAWTLVAQQYMNLPSQVLFGTYCQGAMDPFAIGPNLLSLAQASFTAYGTPPGSVARATLISAGTLDSKTIGVKFSKPVNSLSATYITNYSISQGTITGAKLGIGGDAVYLTVSGLSSSTFIVTVNNVADTSGNVILANSSVSGKTTALATTDIGYIQHPASRPTAGDDPYVVGQAVATSSDDAAEIEIKGGGSNMTGNGDYLSYVYNPVALSGDFDVACKVTRFDRPDTAGSGGNDRAGLLLRSALYNTGQSNTVSGTEVPFVAVVTSHEGSGGPVSMWRTAANGSVSIGAQLGWATKIAGRAGYLPGMNGTNSAGATDSASSPYNAQWLRLKRAGNTFTFYACWDGFNWHQFDTQTLVLPSQLLLGYGAANDSGNSAAPFSAYPINGYTIDPNDPQNPAKVAGWVTGDWIQNDSNFTVSKARLYLTGTVGLVKATPAGGKVSVQFAGTLVQSSSLNGPWTAVSPQPASPYLVTPPANSTVFYRVIP